MLTETVLAVSTTALPAASLCKPSTKGVVYGELGARRHPRGGRQHAIYIGNSSSRWRAHFGPLIMGCGGSTLGLTTAHDVPVPQQSATSLPTSPPPPLSALAPIPATLPLFGPSRSLEVSGRIKPCHSNALAFARRFAAENSSISLARLLNRAPSLGLTADDVFIALEYIMKYAPLVVHIPEVTIRLLATESHYKNGYETGKLRGTSRDPHENSLYGNAYQGALPADKLKYGSINVLASEAGNPLAMGYGSCYFSMKREMRECVTFYYASVATPEYFAHVLEAYPDNEIRLIVQKAKGGSPVTLSTQLTECHWHCELELEACVEALHVPASFINDPCISKFRARGIAVKAFSDQQARHHYSY